MASAGIDIGGSSVKAVRLPPSGDRVETRVPYDLTSRDLDLASVLAAIRTAAVDIDMAPGDSLGVCMPGLVDPNSGIVLRAANLRCMEGQHPAQLLAEALGVSQPPVISDANAWGLGVSHAQPTTGRLLVIAIGTGIGGAFLIDGNLKTLDGVSPGHLGMIDVSFDQTPRPPSSDGSEGTLESYAGGRALLSRFGEDGLRSAIESMNEDDPALRALVRGLRIFHAIYKPHAIRLCGGIGSMLKPHLPVLHEQTTHRLTSVAQEGWTLDVTNDPFLAAVGAATIAKTPKPVRQ